MGLLSANAIKAALASREIIIDPPPTEEQFDSDSVDVHLGNTIYKWKGLDGGAKITIPLWRSAAGGAGAFSYREFANQNSIVVPPDADGIVTLRPQTFYLADLHEHTTLGPNIAMHIQGKSSLARLGVAVHVTAPHAHAGWYGRITLEIFNYGPFNIELKPGVPVGQLFFWRVEDPVSADAVKPQQFTGQERATGARE